MAGKDKLGRGITISIDDSGGTARDVTGDLIPNSLNGLGFTAGEVDMTGTGEDMNYLADVKDMNLTMQFHANDTADTGATTVLNGIIGGSAGTITVQVGSGGASPTTGDLELEGEFVCTGAPLSVQNGRLVHQATFRPSGSTTPAWGTV